MVVLLGMTVLLASTMCALAKPDCTQQCHQQWDEYYHEVSGEVWGTAPTCGASPAECRRAASEHNIDTVSASAVSSTGNTVSGSYSHDHSATYRIMEDRVAAGKQAKCWTEGSCCWTGTKICCCVLMRGKRVPERLLLSNFSELVEKSNAESTKILSDRDTAVIDTAKVVALVGTLSLLALLAVGATRRGRASAWVPEEELLVMDEKGCDLSCKHPE